MKKKYLYITALGLFSLFFGAGNLILPPNLGFKSGDQWIWVGLGFALSAVLIPMLGILAHARLQGTIYDFGKKVSRGFALTYAYLIYAIAIFLPAPRTASVTHEMAVAPFYEISPWLSSSLYFALVLIFVLNRSKIIGFIGKWLTPIILFVLVAIMVLVFSVSEAPVMNLQENPFSFGLLEGYQTFDAIGAVVVGGVVIISIRLDHPKISFEENYKLISRAGFLAGTGLLLLYCGLIFSGKLLAGTLPPDSTRTYVLQQLAETALGNKAGLLLGILIALACFTTAIGIVTGSADFISRQFGNSKTAYKITAIIGCFLGVIMGQFGVETIIALAIPALMFIYPLTIALILLNVCPDKYTPPHIFRSVVFAVLVFSIPDFLSSIGFADLEQKLGEYIPLHDLSLGWLLPAFVIFALLNLISRRKPYEA